MFLDMVGLLFLAVVTSARHKDTKLKREWGLLPDILARESRTLETLRPTTAKSQRQSDEGEVDPRVDFCEWVCGLCEHSELVEYEYKHLCKNHCLEDRRSRSYLTCLSVYREYTKLPVTRKLLSPTRTSDVDARAIWSATSRCPRGALEEHSFVRGYSQWQDFTEGFILPSDNKGTTKIEFHCQVPRVNQTCSKRKDCKWMQSGVEAWWGSRNMGRVGCQHPRQFVTGLRAIFGGPSLGIVSIGIICSVPHWNSTPEKKKGKRMPQDETWENSWTPDKYKGREKKEVDCDPGQAVCGMRTNGYDELVFEDGTGLSEVEILCCPFPSSPYFPPATPVPPPIESHTDATGISPDGPDLYPGFPRYVIYSYYDYNSPGFRVDPSLRPVFCPKNTFARSVEQWQGDYYVKRLPIPYLGLRCEAPNEYQVCNKTNCTWIHSSPKEGKELEINNTCPHHRQWIMGIRVNFGGNELGMVGMVGVSVICDVPEWAWTPDKYRGLKKPRQESFDTWLPGFEIELSEDTYRWSQEQMCPPRTAVCGLSTNKDAVSSGINQVWMYCCPWLITD